MLVLAPALEWLPMAALGAILVRVAWTMADVPHVVGMLRRSPRSDVFVLLACFGLTVVFDMVWAVTVGFVLAALLFMKRMADLSGATLHQSGTPDGFHLPDGVMVYDINGPLFFGAAEKAMDALRRVSAPPAVMIINLTHVPAMDATGLVGLENALTDLRQSRVVLVGLQSQPRVVLARAGLLTRPELTVVDSLREGLDLARRWVARTP